MLIQETCAQNGGGGDGGDDDGGGGGCGGGGSDAGDGGGGTSKGRVPNKKCLKKWEKKLKIKKSKIQNLDFLIRGRGDFKCRL